MNANVPAHILSVLRALGERGYRSWVVGGAVRDMVLGRERSDFDIATPATPEQVIAVFPKAIPTGIEHGTVTVLAGGEPVEITTFRGDGAYSDGRRPDSVTFLTNIEADLARRDFTVNAMAFDPLTGEFCDPFGGREDAARKILRAVGNAHERFSEDGLRIMRAARFAAELGFHIEATTFDAMVALRGMLTKVSQERITKELLRLLGARYAVAGMEAMLETDLYKIVLPEGNWGATRTICENVPRQDVEGRLAALLTYELTGDRNEIEKVCERLKLSNAQTKDVSLIAWATWNLHLIASSTTLTTETVRRIASVAGMLRTLRAVSVMFGFAEGKGSRVAATAAEAFEGNPALTVGELAVNGNDLKALGLQGKQIGVVLKTMLDTVLHNPEKNTCEALLALVGVA